MAKMPRGEPRSTVDPADRKMDEARAKRRAEERGLWAPLEMAQDALQDFQNGPPIQRPNLAQSFIPVVGSAWEAAADLQEGDYAGAAFNGAMAVLDVLPVGVVAKGGKAALKGVSVLTDGSKSAKAAVWKYRNRGMVKPGYEVHHTVPLDGTSRSAQDWRNNFALLKPLPVEQHRRLHGSWQGKPMYDPVRRVWYGTTDWQKVAPTYLAAKAADAAEHRSAAPAPPDRPRQRR